MGYVFATALEMLFFLGVLEIFGTILVIYFSICEYSIAFATDIKDRCGEFKKNAELCRGKFPMAKQTELYENLCEIIEFHSEAIQFSIYLISFKIQFISFNMFTFHRFVRGFFKFYKSFIGLFFVISTLYLSIFFVRMHFVSKWLHFVFASYSKIILFFHSIRIYVLFI